MLADYMPQINLELLATVAWRYRDRALTLGRTRVGAAVLAADGAVFGGCNVQHRFRSQDVHAEVTAITSMVAAGQSTLSAIVVVSEFHGLTPCGGCLDWILQLGGDDCVVAWQQARDAAIISRRALDLMPFHPPYGDVDAGSR